MTSKLTTRQISARIRNLLKKNDFRPSKAFPSAVKGHKNYTPGFVVGEWAWNTVRVHFKEMLSDREVQERGRAYSVIANAGWRCVVGSGVRGGYIEIPMQEAPE